MTYEQFLQRYTFDDRTDKLGEGGFGTVFKAYDNTLDRQVAVKVCPVKEGGYSLKEEVEMVAHFEHPNIAKYERSYRLRVGFGEHELAIMQYYPDGNLAEYVRQHTPQGEELKTLIRGILEGLQFLHSSADGKPVIVHRDMKPSNILVVRRPDGTPIPKIADFGIARASVSGKSLTPGAFTTQYMSPEQSNFERLDYRTDLWSFGSILYFLCTGQHAFRTADGRADGEASASVITQQIRNYELPSIDGIAQPYRNMIAACWQPRNDRAQSAATLLRLLDGKEAEPNPVKSEIPTFDPEIAVATIQQLIQTKDYDTALAKCKEALFIAPTHPRLLQLHEKLKPKPVPDTFDPKIAIATVQQLMEAKNYPTALAQCNNALAQLPNNHFDYPRLLHLKTEIEKKMQPSTIWRWLIAAVLIMATWFWLVYGLGNKNTDTDPTTQQPVQQQQPEEEEIPVEFNEDGFEMVLIPEGNFKMGSEEYDDEQPIHTVTFNSFFYMSKYEVTQKQWTDIMGSNPSKFSGCDNCPVEQVSWDDIQDFLRKLNAQTGKNYRLPTEAEWEYACRAGTTTTFNTGDNLTTDQANYDGNWSWKDYPKGIYRAKTTPVGSFAPNAWGLYDMHGNVWEWCQDVWHDDYTGAPTNGAAWLAGDNQSLHVLRGGSWRYSAGDCRSALRLDYDPDYRNFNIGFRIAL